MSRETCFDCVRKHLAQASILLDEAQLGYPRHFWLAVGHLAEAESESMREHPEFAIEIRACRMDLMSHSVQFLQHEYQGPCMDTLIGRACEVVEDWIYLKQSKINSKQFAPLLAEIDERLEAVSGTPHEI